MTDGFNPFAPAPSAQPDKGPWTVSIDGRHVYSEDFEHDVKLKIDGDFADEAQRVAYAVALATRLNGAQPEPPYYLSTYADGRVAVCEVGTGRIVQWVGAQLAEPAPHPYPLNEYALDQWWFAELQSIRRPLALSEDQYRAVAVAINLARVALSAQPRQEPQPVAWRFAASYWPTLESVPVSLRDHAEPLYAVPAPAPVRLTDEQMLACVRSVGTPAPMGLTRDRGPYEVTEPTWFLTQLVRAIERAHGIGGGE